MSERYFHASQEEEARQTSQSQCCFLGTTHTCEEVNEMVAAKNVIING